MPDAADAAKVARRNAAGYAAMVVAPATADLAAQRAAHEAEHLHDCDPAGDLDWHQWTHAADGCEPDSHKPCEMHADPQMQEVLARLDATPYTVVETRLPAGASPRPAAATTSPDPAQKARRALLFYLATGCPHPKGMPNHLNIRDIDLAVILHGLVDEPFEAKWDHVEATAGVLRQVLDAGGVGTTSEAYAEGLLLDAVNSCAPDRGAL